MLITCEKLIAYIDRCVFESDLIELNNTMATLFPELSIPEVYYMEEFDEKTANLVQCNGSMWLARLVKSGKFNPYEDLWYFAVGKPVSCTITAFVKLAKGTIEHIFDKYSIEILAILDNQGYDTEDIMYEEVKE